MSDHEFDFIVIGGGSAGYAGASCASARGLKTAVIEGGAEIGGLCILRGCMPSKTFLESGHRAHAIRQAAEFGLRAEYHGADGAFIQARKKRLVQEFASYRQEQFEHGPWEFIRGLARFVGPHELEVALHAGGTQRVRAKAFLVATGSETRWFPIEGVREAQCLTSDEVLASEHIPESVIVLGAGPTGSEFASYYAGLGCEVTIVQRGQQLLKGMDADVATALASALEARGIRIHTGTDLKRVERSGGRKRVHFELGGRPQSVEAEEIIYALGRKPAIAGLGLDQAGVRVEQWGGIHATCHQQSIVPHIFVAGDVCGPYEVVHIGVQQGELAARNAARMLQAAGEPLEEMDYSLKIFAVFTHPQVASVGLSAREAQELDIAYAEAAYGFADHGKSMVRGETEGFVKLLVAGKERKIIGGAAVGPEAAELIHEIVMAMRFGATAAQVAALPHYHPTLSEIWTYPAEALAMAQF